MEARKYKTKKTNDVSVTHNTHALSNSNMAVRITGTFTSTFWNEYSTIFLMIPRLMNFALVVL